MAKSYTIKDCKLLFRNFAGKPTKYNPAGGKRTFSILLDERLAEELSNEGFNVKPLKMREGDEEQMYHLSIKVSFAKRPPRVVLINGKKRQTMSEDSIGALDYFDIERADVCISPYHWHMDGGRSGVAAYLKLAYVTLEYSELDEMYLEEDDEDDEDDAPF